MPSASRARVRMHTTALGETAPDVPHLDVPEGWEPIANACRRLASNLEELGDRVTGCIRQEICSVPEEAVLPAAELRASVFIHLQHLLHGLGEQRGPLPTELDTGREFARRCAEQGATVDAILQANHIRCREVWQALVAETLPEGETAAPLLIAAGTGMSDQAVSLSRGARFMRGSVLPEVAQPLLV
jgi:hypothetical protein